MTTTTRTRPAAAGMRADGASLNEVVTSLEQIERESRRLDATRMGLVARAARLGEAGGEFEYRAIRAELATALHMSEQTVSAHLSLAHELVYQYPKVHSVLEAGGLSRAHAKVIVDAGSIIGIGDDANLDASELAVSDIQARRDAYTARVLVYAVRETPGRLRPIARQLAEEYAEASIEVRHQVAVLQRRVCVFDAEDGMADLYAHIPAVEAHAIHDRLTQAGRRIKLATILDSQVSETTETTETAEAPGDSSSNTKLRTMDEIRADVLTDLLLATDPTMIAGTGAAAIQARVQVIVPAATVDLKPERANGDLKTDPNAASANSDDPDADDSNTAGATPVAPSVLMKHGVIPASTARLLAGTAAHWENVTVTPDTGDVLKVDRYRPSEQMRRTLAARDLHCRFPGCRAPISRCDIDHTVDAAKGGVTSTSNLSYLCRGHHVLKHQTGWRVTQLSGGVMEWVSPTGRTHVDRPPSRVYFQKSQAAPPSGPSQPHRSPDPHESTCPPDEANPSGPTDPPDSPSRSESPESPDAPEQPAKPTPPKSDLPPPY